MEWSANRQSCRCLEGETSKPCRYITDWSACVFIKVYFSDASGIDVWIENVRGGECLRIRERRQVKVGHVAIGISDQVKDSRVSVTKTEIKPYFTKPTLPKLKLSSLTKVSGKAFTLETLDRKSVAFDQEITESCVWLCCVPAPDRCQRWRWRVRDGRLELRE